MPENTPPGVNIGEPISATDPDETGAAAIEFGNTLTYKLGGTDADKFDIDPSTGQLITKAPLDAETKASYTVEVTVDDGESRETPLAPQTVLITVTPVVEEPAAPAAPAVVSGAGEDSTTSLKVIWHEPDNTGRSITAYSVEHKKTTDLEFTDSGHNSADTTTTINALDVDTSYHVRVKATGEGESPWSLVGTGSTNKENNGPPTFGTTAVATRNVFENTPAGQDVGAPVTANDNDATTLTYVLDGPHADSFSFDTASGQIRTKSPLNHEDPVCGYDSTGSPPMCTYKVTVTVTDGAGGSDATAVNIMVGDRHEPVLAPARPTVRPAENWSTRLDISWNAPTNTGPPITGYAVRYRQDSTGAFLNDNCGSADDDNSCDSITGTKTTIFGLTAGKSHQVQVLTLIAGTPARRSVWSDSGTGSTNAANKEPRFDDRPSSSPGSARESDYTTTRNVDENTRPGQPVGMAVRAEDGDGHSRTYRLAEADSPNAEHFNMFDIDKSSGQIRTKSPLNLEAECSDGDAGLTGGHLDNCTYTVRVQVWDGFNEHKVEEDGETPVVDDTITVTINVRDKEETPEVPTVTVTSPSGNTTLVVTWDAPANTGPTTLTYDVQYRKGNAAFSNDNCGSEAVDNCDGLTATTTTIMGLEADTSYSVQVRARNAEGPSAWSRLAAFKTNKGTNVPPDLFASTVAFSVSENTRSGQLVGQVTATDNDSDRWSYNLGGADAGSFNFNKGTGEITTKSGLDFEEKVTYSVRVRADDGRDGGSSARAVTITVINEDEPPIPPAAPRVTATQNSGWSLDVTWNEPRNMTGKPPIIDYDLQYRKLGDTTWQTWPHGADAADATAETGETEKNTKITRVAEADDATHLEPRTQYEVEVRATNAEGTSDWSPIGRGTTGAGNSRPSFDRTEALVTLRVDENTRSGQNVGSAISATDADGNRLTYRLEGPGKDSFTIVSSSGQIKTKSPLDHESRSSYSVTVKVDDGTRRANSGAAKSVAIKVDDVDEIPPPPPAPSVAGIAGSTDSVRVTWNAPSYTGPAITDYEVRWGIARSGGWNTLVGRTGADTSQIITALVAGTRYDVQVRAKSAEGTSEWSRSGTGTPNPDVANRPPAFSGSTRTFSIAENTGPGVDLGAPVAATDRDGDVLTYTLEGTDADSFDILSTGTGGQIQTSAALNHEEKASYSVTVRVADGRGGTDAVNVRITVTDVNGEAPDPPEVPTVTPVSSTSLSVSWDEPGNAGPPITDYDYRYREPGQTWTEVTGTTIRETTVTIEGLRASTFYDVEVRATNDEGTSGWSNAGTGQTNAPGANNPPVFSDGASTTRRVSAGAQAGMSIGLPVMATDADSGDTLTYTLEGRDAAFFDIGETNGQLLTKSGVTLIAATTYTVTVAADDGTDIARITVSINATAAPPNNPPVFSDGASTTRSVSASASAGTSIGLPVAATDADSGDTLTYSLEGTDAASFDINTTNGQLLTRSGVTLTTGEIYTVTVVASDGKTRASITVTIEVTTALPNSAPTFSSTSATRSVDENSAAGTDIGLPVSATDVNAGDTLTYRLSGADAASFNIVSGTGQLRTNAALDYETDFRYSVTITVSDGELTDSIRVTINIMDMHPSCASAIGNGANTGLANDCEALLDSRDTLEGTGATRSLNWATHTRIADWYGVVLSDTPRRVIQLRLHGQNGNDNGREEKKLKGTIPAELGRLSELEILYFHRNELTGEIPGALNNLSKLQQLYLYDNELTAISGELGSGMAELRRLFAHRNSIAGSIPSGLGDMPRLDWLRLDRNRLTGAIPRQLGNLSTLRRLYLHEQEGWSTGGGFSGGIPSTFSGLSRLEYLVLNRNSLGGQIPSGLGSLSNLKWLGLYDNGFTGSIPSELGSLSNLERLYLHGNQLTGSVPTQLGSLSSLTNLWLKNNSLSGPIPEQLSQLELNRLRLSGSGLTACVPEGLVPTRTLYKSDGTEIPPTDDIEEAGLTVCGSGN